MIVKKYAFRKSPSIRKPYVRKKERKPFVRKQGGHLFLNCTIRDVILPHEYVWVDFDCQLRKVTLIPTHEEDAYKMSFTQTRNAKAANICWWGLDRICHIPDRTRFEAKIEDNGTITFVVPET